MWIEGYAIFIVWPSHLAIGSFHARGTARAHVLANYWISFARRTYVNADVAPCVKTSLTIDVLTKKVGKLRGHIGAIQ
jgi:hypothetical protein